MSKKSIKVGAAEGIAVAENEGLDISNVQVNTLEAHLFTEDYEPTHKATSEAKFHKPGEPIIASSTVIEKMVKLGWATPLALAFMVLSFFASAQTSVIAPLYNATNIYSLALLNASVTTLDSVTNTGTGVMTCKRVAGPGTVTIQVNVIKKTGTVAGTITLLGSLDGVNFKAIPTRETQTAIATITAADASGSYMWRLTDSPCLYYQVSWTGAGTMFATFTATILKH